jgi:hypothetical protein
MAHMETQRDLALDQERYLGADSMMTTGEPGIASTKSDDEYKTESSEYLESVGNFRRIARVQPTTEVVITKWRSEITGLRVVHIDYESALFSIYYMFFLTRD